MATTSVVSCTVSEKSTGSWVCSMVDVRMRLDQLLIVSAVPPEEG